MTNLIAFCIIYGTYGKIFFYRGDLMKPIDKFKQIRDDYVIRQVVLQHYGRQAYRVKKLKKYKLNQLVLIANSRCLPGLYGQDVQSISTGKLHTSRCFHIQPINVVVCNGLY